jgi:hypothetical protein
LRARESVLALSLSQVIAPRWRNKKAKNMTRNMIDSFNFVASEDSTFNALEVNEANTSYYENFSDMMLNCTDIEEVARYGVEESEEIRVVHCYCAELIDCYVVVHVESEYALIVDSAHGAELFMLRAANHYLNSSNGSTLH